MRDILSVLCVCAYVGMQSLDFQLSKHVTIHLNVICCHMPLDNEGIIAQCWYI